MPMNVPSLGLISAPQGLDRLTSLELLNRQICDWREEAEVANIELPDLKARDTGETSSQFLGRINSLTLRAEQGDDQQRVDPLENSINQSLAEVQRAWTGMQPNPETLCKTVINLADSQANPFLAARIIREFDQRVAGMQADSESVRAGSEVHVRDVAQRYLLQRNRAAALDGLRSDSQSQESESAVPDKSPGRIYLAYLLSAMIIAVILTYILSMYIGGASLSKIFISAILTVVIFMALSLRRGGQFNAAAEESNPAEAPLNLLPAEFKRELRDYAEARLNRVFAESEVARLTSLRETWGRLIDEQNYRDASERFEQVCTWVSAQLAGAPEGFFNEILPGEILLYGRALSQLLVRNLMDHAERERKQDGVAFALHANQSAPWRERLASSSAAEVGEELARAAAEIVGELNFSTTLQMVLRDPEGEVAAKTWFDRLRKEVLAASTLIEGLNDQNSDVREVLNCGLPGGRTDLLASEMAKQFDCEIYQSTIPNGLELVCVTRNVELDELSSTRQLEAAYLKFDPKVSEIYFDFPSRQKIAVNASGKVHS